LRAKYERVRYAFVAFKTKQDAETLLQEETPVYIKNNHVMWLEPETKTCHICQGREHLAANCPRIQERNRNERKILKFSDLYKRKRVNADNVDSIHKKAANITQKKSYLEAAKTTISTPKNQNSIEARLTRLEDAMKTIQKTINRLLEKNSTHKTSKPTSTPTQTPITLKKPSPNTELTKQQQPRTPEKKSTNSKKSKNQSDIETSVHNPCNSEDTFPTPQAAQRMSILETNVNKILQMLNQLQDSPYQATNNNSISPMELQDPNTIPS
jgi:hypothetical protein